MQRHQHLLAPKFALVQEILEERLGESKIASWTDPKGGYFVNLDVLARHRPSHCRTGEGRGHRRHRGGIGLPASKRPGGQEHPHRADVPGEPDLREAIDGLATCALLRRPSHC